MKHNIFASLAKYNAATNENFLTESLVFLAKLFLDRIPSDGLQFINMLCGLKNEELFQDIATLNISTQVTTSSGKPDIEISDNNSLVYIEVKHDSPLGSEQLERYKAELDNSSASNTKLVLLTRSRHSYVNSTLQPNDYSRVYWYEIYRWLSAKHLQDEVIQYFSMDFLDFLDEKQMSLKKVSPEYELGIPALLNLTNMIGAAIVEVFPGAKITKTGGWFWRGFYLPGNYWVGVRYFKPSLITFENNRGYDPVTFRQTLNLDTEDFFALDEINQFDCLVNFLQVASKDLQFN